MRRKKLHRQARSLPYPLLRIVLRRHPLGVRLLQIDTKMLLEVILSKRCTGILGSVEVA